VKFYLIISLLFFMITNVWSVDRISI